MTTRPDASALATEWAEYADRNLREARHSRTQAQTRAAGLDSAEEAQQAERWKRRAEQSTAKAKESRLMALMWAAVAAANAPIEALAAEHDRRQRTEIELEHWQRVIVPEVKAERDAAIAALEAGHPDAEPVGPDVVPQPNPDTRCRYCGCLDRNCDKCITECALPPDAEPDTSKPIEIHRRSAPDILRFHADVLAQISRGAATSEAFSSIVAARVGMNLLADQLEAQD